MPMKLTFLGAARNVTGSRHLLEANNARFLVDCGLFQERALKARNWEPFPVRPDTLDGVLLTHAHLDHCGWLPRLVREGFKGRIYCTSATSDVVRIMLMDSAHIQEEDAAFKKRRHEREGRKGPFPEMPLYTITDAMACFPLLSPVPYKVPVKVGDGVAASFYEAGHILGSSMIKVEVKQSGANRTLLFSGDVGRWKVPILRDPTLFSEADYILVESTYGDRLHKGLDTIADEFTEVINSTVKAGGNIVVPSFALERSQELLYYYNKLLNEDRVPHLLVFVDSPMAVRVTDEFTRHPELYNGEMAKLIKQGKSPFEFPGLVLVRAIDQSKAINRIGGTAMIIAGSGMCDGGRIKHHLVTNISRPESTILFVGYQAMGTLGRQIVDGATEVRILGQTYPVRARIVQIDGFSAHADRDELLRWLSGLKRPPRRLFVVHGEAETAGHFADLVREKMGWAVSAPEYQEQAELE